jgi:tyrosyl-tRNA synthetase
MQGWDSVEIRADVELGGTEQLYNLIVGRDLQRASHQEPQICLTMPILRSWTQDAEGNYQKMGKSLNNYIAVGESAKEQFGKTMRIPDVLMKEWLTLLTNRPDAEIDSIVAGHPNEAKKLLATDIVTLYRGADVAAATLADWNKQFGGGGKQDPDAIEEVTLAAGKLKDGAMPAVDLIAETKLAASKGEARRKIEEGAFNYGPDRTKVTDVKATISVADGLVIRLGRKIFRVRIK